MLKVAPPGKRALTRATRGGGAIFDIVGISDFPVGTTLRADNVKGGSARETRADTSRQQAGTPKDP